MRKRRVSESEGPRRLRAETLTRRSRELLRPAAHGQLWHAAQQGSKPQQEHQLGRRCTHSRLATIVVAG